MSVGSIQSESPALPNGHPFHIGTRTIIHRNESGEIINTEYVPLTEEDFLHPQEEDRFMLTDPHTIACQYLCHALNVGLRDREKIKVLSDHRIDWQVPGILPHGPDVAVFDNFEAETDDYWGTLHVQDIGAKTMAVFEVTSESTRKIDIGKKFAEFEVVRIPYYLIVDLAAPNGLPDILAFRYSKGNYEEMRRDPKLGFLIPKLGLWFRVEEDRVIVADELGKDIPDSKQMAFQLDDASSRAESERARAESEKARAESERARAESEKARAESEKARAESETARAEALAAELAELKARLSGSTPKE
jgi:colicin import membrane protein